MNKQDHCSVIDTFTRKVINTEGKYKMEKLLNLKTGSIYSLFKKKRMNFTANRYVRNDGIIYWTTLVDFETGEEFDCVSHASLYLQLGIEYNKREAYAFKRIKKNRGLAGLAGRTFYIKGTYPKRFFGNTKNIGPKLNSILIEQRKKYKMASVLRVRIKNGIIYGKGKKTTKTESLMGCKIDFMLGWLESQFTEGMSWDNFGEWHIDHIKPCNTFNMLDVEEQKKCFHYTNCRPLWAYDNLSRPKDGSDILNT